MNESSRRMKAKPGWMKALIGLSLSIAVILALYLALDVWNLGFQAAPCERERGFLRKLVCGISATYEYKARYVRCLPSDEEMLDHFHRHRVDFERLVQIYRKEFFLPAPWGEVEPTPPIAAIMKRIEVSSIRGDRQTWMPPDPYSEEAKRQIRKLGITAEAVARGWPEAREYSGVLLTYAPARIKRLNENLPDVYKGYYYTPFAPKIEGGRLVTPTWTPRVFETLTRYPIDFEAGDCVYRQFEPQWFLELCQGVP